MKTIFLGLTGLTTTLALTALAAPVTPFRLIGGSPRTLTPTALAAIEKTATPGQAAADHKTLTFQQRAIRLVARTGPDKDMLSYRIAGLRNPTLIVPRGATLKALFVNTDDDMLHDLRFGAAQKTYPNRADALVQASVGTPPLPHKSATALHAEELTVRLPSVPGTYAYFCTVRGHAQGGMIGLVIVR